MTTMVVSMEVKLQIAQEVNAGQYLAYKVHKERNINHRTVLKYANMVKKGLALHSSSGRPRLLDEVAMLEVLNFLALNPDPNYSDYRSLVITKCKETWLRRHKYTNDIFQAPKVSKRAVATYLKALKEQANALAQHGQI